MSEALVAEIVPETMTKEKQKLIIIRVIVRVWVVVYNPTGKAIANVTAELI